MTADDERSDEQVQKEETDGRAPAPRKRLVPVAAPMLYKNEEEDVSRATLRVGIGHVFTTGPNVRTDRIVHVAGLRYAEQEPPTARDWMLNPGRKITRRIFERSHVSTALSREQPAWEDIGDLDVTPFFAELDVLFVFNAEGQIDWFRRKVLAGVREAPVCVDLHRLARFFLPEHTFLDAAALIERFVPEKERPRGHPRLPVLMRALSALLQEVIASVLFTAGEGTTGHLVYTLLERAASGDRAPVAFRVLLDVVREAHRVQWRKDLFGGAFEPPRPVPTASMDAERMTGVIRGMLPEDDGPEAGRRPPEEETVRPVRADEIRQGFEHAGLHPRESQVPFAVFCADAINRGGLYAIEAGTGTGKTLGYLVPACEFVRRNPGRRVLIVTATKNLQDQIIAQELPKLASGKSLYRDVRGAVLKGKANYLCITALTDLFEEVFGPPAGGEAGAARSANGAIETRQLAWLYLFLRLIRSGGTLEGIPKELRTQFPMLDDYLAEVNAQLTCTAGFCRMGPACVYPRRLREARAADIVVTNQHKLAFIDPVLQERVWACIVDEADQLPGHLRSSLKDEVSRYRLTRLLQRLVGSPRRRGFAQVLSDRLAEREDDAADRCRRAMGTVMAEGEHVKTVLLEMDALVEEQRYGAVRWKKMRPVGADHRLGACLKRLALHLQRIVDAWERVLDSGRYAPLDQTPNEGALNEGERKALQHRQGWLRRERARVARYREMTVRAYDAAGAVAEAYPSAEYVHVVDRMRRSWAVRRFTLDIAVGVERHLSEPFATTLFTSATLFVNDRLDFFTRELGLEDPLDGEKRIRSPFDYQGRVLGVVPSFMPLFRGNASPALKKQWMDAVTEAVAQLCVALYGRTLVLFTNRMEMRDIYERVRPVLERHDIDPLLQNGSSLAEINTFRETEHSVLFGVDRFWTGVDFPGPTLSQVIVVRLPNPSLGDPLIEHRLEHQGDAFWEQTYRPLARLRLKQGFGRLMRSERDRGLFVVLDRRLLDDARMRDMQRELPVPMHRFPGNGAADPIHGLIDLAREGLKRLELTPEFEAREVDLARVFRPGR